MAAFYRGLMAGKTKAAALQEAQLEVRDRHPHPFYWAGFVLMGEDGKLISEKRPAERLLG